MVLDVGWGGGGGGGTRIIENPWNFMDLYCFNFLPTPHRSAQSPHKCAQVRTGPRSCVWGVPEVGKKVPEVPKSPKSNRTGRLTHPHSILHTPSGCQTFSKNLDLRCCYCRCCWRPLAPNQTSSSFHFDCRFVPYPFWLSRLQLTF